MVKVVFNPKYMSNKSLNQRVNVEKLIKDNFSKNVVKIDSCDVSLRQNSKNLNKNKSVNSKRETIGECAEVTSLDSIVDSCEEMSLLDKKVVIEHLDTIASLLEWRNNDRNKVLYLSGSPYTGKTSLIKIFINRYFKGHYYYIDLSKYRNCLSNLLKDFPNKFFPRGLKDSGDTIVVFDNISLCPSLIPLLVSHFSNLKSSLCLVGSPLDNISDYDFYEVYLSPLNFKEFIFNLKLNDVLLDSLDDYYNIYSKIGGYPKVVSLYIKTLDISECQSLLKSLLSDLLSKISIPPWEDDWGVYLHNLSGLLFYSTSLDYSSDSDYLSFLDTLLKYNYLSYLDNTYYFNDLGFLNLLYQDYHSDLDSLYTNLGLLFNFILLNSSDKLSSISFNFSTKSYHLCLDNLLIDLKRVSQISDVYSL